MDSLPQEIFSKIFDLLPIVDARRFTNLAQYDSTISKKSVLSYKDRISLWLYLQPYFPDLKLLLALMWFCEVPLLGSRAAEYFVPGSCSKDSDFDFFVSDSKSHCEVFIKGLENMGVYFEKIYEKFEKVLFDEDDSIVIDQDDMSDIKEYIKSPQCSQRLKDIYEPYKQHINLMMMNYKFPRKFMIVDNKLWSEFSALETGYGTIRNIKRVINGTLKHKSKTVKIQITVQRNIHNITDIIFRFHSSAVQCFINPIMACHLYGELSSSKKIYFWKPKDNYRNIIENQEECKDKYISRGYNNSSPHIPIKPANFRSIRDSMSTVIMMPSYIYIPDEYRTFCTNMASFIKWYEFTNNVENIESPIRSSKSQTKTFRKNAMEYSHYLKRTRLTMMEESMTNSEMDKQLESEILNIRNIPYRHHMDNTIFH